MVNQINIVLCYYRYGSCGAKVIQRSKYIPKTDERANSGLIPIPWDEIKPFTQKWGFLVHCGSFPDHMRKELQKKYGKYLDKKYWI